MITECKIIDYSDKAFAIVGETKTIKEQLRALGGRFNPRLTCGAGWIFSKTKIDSVRGLINDEPATIQPNENNPDTTYLNALNNYLKISRIINNKPRIYDGAVELCGGYFPLVYPTIETRFCFSDEGASYELYCKLTRNVNELERYFVDYNMSRINQDIELLSNTTEPIYYSCINEQHQHYSVCNSNTIEWCRNRGEIIELTDEQRITLLNAYKWEKARFTKRLRTYLKRYGTRKLHLWTYWANR